MQLTAQYVKVGVGRYVITGGLVRVEDVQKKVPGGPSPLIHSQLHFALLDHKDWIISEMHAIPGQLFVPEGRVAVTRASRADMAEGPKPGSHSQPHLPLVAL